MLGIYQVYVWDIQHVTGRVSFPGLISALWRVSLSQSHVTTDGQSASMSWCRAPIWGLRPDFYFCQTFVGFLTWCVLSDDRVDRSFTIAAGPRQRSHSRVPVARDS
jgi:hypothetical protein